jgi:hypothetical protein
MNRVRILLEYIYPLVGVVFPLEVLDHTVVGSLTDPLTFLRVIDEARDLLHPHIYRIVFGH